MINNSNSENYQGQQLSFQKIDDQYLDQLYLKKNQLKLQAEQLNNKNIQASQIRTNSNLNLQSSLQTSLSDGKNQFQNQKSYRKYIQDKKQEKYKKTSTKNVPKNYGNAIVNFIEKQEEQVKILIQQFLSKTKYNNENKNNLELNYPEFKQYIQILKKRANLATLQKCFRSFNSKSETEQQYEQQNNSLNEQFKLKLFNKLIRIFAFKFLRQEATVYFFNNRKILRSEQMRQARRTFLYLIRDPDQFVGIKIRPQIQYDML
ncbi:hypothetical protein PPERSA_01803 [Pseudocohnilembus persalinus]|uniref:Uncharacterized protein n=1 Tax=Pseudocohnilembus persalinus TaxID=266149 RepID=A0A0V0QKB5_PSEPJ|nr:hypothetical protein PPERSA_01803 [Pseudocohnilembus persalinus]|eukprot:KRX02686.1 hypothetical protein PPERSA_01803 [Pseudocohnilembus persalinus]